jgi:hypothetical protein
VGLNSYLILFPTDLKLLFLINKKNLNFLNLTYLKFNPLNFKYVKQTKVFKSNRKLKGLIRLRLKNQLNRTNLEFKKFCFSSSKLIDSSFQFYRLKYKKAFFFLYYRLNFENRFVLKQNKTKRFSKFIKTKRKKRKLKRRKGKKNKSTILKYLIRFFIFRRSALLNNGTSLVRSSVGLKRFEAFGSRRLRTVLLRKYLIKKYLSHRIKSTIL